MLLCQSTDSFVARRLGCHLASVGLVFNLLATLFSFGPQPHENPTEEEETGDDAGTQASGHVQVCVRPGGLQASLTPQVVVTAPSSWPLQPP